MNKEQTSKKEIQEGKIFALMGYLFGLCIIPLVLKKENKFVLFHAKQGLVIFVGEVALIVISVIPGLGPFIFRIGFLLFGIASLFGIIQTLEGKYTKITIISDFADKISL